MNLKPQQINLELWDAEFERVDQLFTAMDRLEPLQSVEFIYEINQKIVELHKVWKEISEIYADMEHLKTVMETWYQLEKNKAMLKVRLERDDYPSEADRKAYAESIASEYYQRFIAAKIEYETIHIERGRLHRLGEGLDKLASNIKFNPDK